MTRQRKVPVLSVAAIALLWVVGTVTAQEPEFKGEPAAAAESVALAAEAPAATSEAADSPETAAEPASPAESGALRERTIYIPYGKLRELFEKQGRGVFLPYEEFQALWKAARENTAPAVAPKPPIGALLSEIESEATVRGDVVSVTATLKIEVLGEGWHRVPLRLNDASILSARLENEPARVVFDDSNGYSLLIEQRGAEPRVITLTLEYAKAFEKAPGVNRVRLAAPQAPVNRWRMRVPQRGARVKIEPLIAASQVPEGDETVEETIVLAFLGAARDVAIEWTAKAEGALGQAALASVQVEQQVDILPSVLRVSARLRYEISRARLDRLRFEVPANYKIVNVHDPNVRQWSVETVEGRQQVTVELFGPVQGEQGLTVELEAARDDQPREEHLLAALRALDVGRQQGVIAVVPGEGLRAEMLAAGGLSQVDLSELPEHLRLGNLAFAYRYAAAPAELRIAIEKVRPLVRATELAEAFLDPQQLTWHLNTVFAIERAGVFQLAFDVPEGFEVRRVVGRAIAGSTEAAVDSWQTSGEPRTRLTVNLLHKAQGRVGVFIELTRRLDDPNLLTPTGQSFALAAIPPRVADEVVQQRGGAVVLYAVPSLAVGDRTTTGMRRIALTEAQQALPVPREAQFAALGPVDAYAIGPESATLEAAVTRREPLVAARQLLVVRVEPGVVRYEVTLIYDVSYSAVRAVRLAVPAEFAAQLTNVSPQLRQSVVPAEPEAEAAQEEPEEIIWQFEGDGDLLGAIEIKLQGSRPLPELKVGQAVPVPIPHLRPAGVAHARGQVVLAKTEALDLSPQGEPTGVRPIDPQYDLMVGRPLPDAARAFEFVGDWQLDVLATLYQLEDVKRTSIERALVRAVVTRSDEVAVQALYRLRSARQRLTVALPEGAQFDTQPLRINGRPATLERGDEEFYVPLAGHELDAPLLVELRYTMPRRDGQLDLPSFPEKPAVQQVYLCAYLPEERELLGAHGAWRDENRWRLGSDLCWWPRPNRGDDELLAWVCEGAPVSGELGEGFPTAGRLYVYSTLRPAAPPDGSLELVSLDRTLWRAMLVAAIVALGLVLVRRPLWSRLASLIGVVAGVILLGVFVPTFALHLLDGVALVAIVAMLLGWLAWHLIRGKPTLAGTLGAMGALAATSGAPASADRVARAPSEQGARPADQAAQSVEEPPLAAGEAPPAPPRSPEENPGREEGDAHHG